MREKPTDSNYSFGLLIMYGISYMFRHYIAILREPKRVADTIHN
jgi:hypothetical protein